MNAIYSTVPVLNICTNTNWGIILSLFFEEVSENVIQPGLFNENSDAMQHKQCNRKSRHNLFLNIMILLYCI